MPIGVVRVLLGDLVERGHVRVQATLTDELVVRRATRPDRKDPPWTPCALARRRAARPRRPRSSSPAASASARPPSWGRSPRSSRCAPRPWSPTSPRASTTSTPCPRSRPPRSRWTSVASRWPRTSCSTCSGRRASVASGSCGTTCASGAIGAIVLVDTARLDEAFSPLDYFEAKGLPFIVAVNQFEGGQRLPARGGRRRAGAAAGRADHRHRRPRPRVGQAGAGPGDGVLPRAAHPVVGDVGALTPDEGPRQASNRATALSLPRTDRSTLPRTSLFSTCTTRPGCGPRSTARSS